MVNQSSILKEIISVYSGALKYKNSKIDPRTERVLVEKGIKKEEIDLFRPRHIDNFPSMFNDADLIIGMTNQHEIDLPQPLRLKYQMISQIAEDHRKEVGDPYWSKNYSEFKDLILILNIYLIKLKNHFETYFSN
jgi:protein-tyrosine-phosphatase